MLLAFDAQDLITFVIVTIMALGGLINHLTQKEPQAPAPPPRRPPPRGPGEAGPGGGAGAGAAGSASVQDELQEFLRKAAARRQADANPTAGSIAARSEAPADAPAEPEILDDDDVEVLEPITPLEHQVLPTESATTLSSTSSTSPVPPESSIARLPSQFDREAPVKRRRKRQKPVKESLESHVHQAFDHQLGTFDAQQSAPVPSASTVTAAEARPLVESIKEMLQNPDDARRAFVLTEIFRRPQF